MNAYIANLVFLFNMTLPVHVSEIGGACAWFLGFSFRVHLRPLRHVYGNVFHCDAGELTHHDRLHLAAGSRSTLRRAMACVR